MKATLRTLVVGLFLACASLISAQQVSTLYFLENAPMRHTINPAFQPVSNFYLTLPLLGYSNVWLGTNGWTMADFVFKGPNGNTITPFHPDAMDWGKKNPKQFALDVDINANILGFGFRVKDGYFHFNVSEHLYVGTSVSSSIFLLNKINTEVDNTYSLSATASAYTEIAAGYSHRINEKWTVGGTLKALLGQAHFKAGIDELTFRSTVDELYISATGGLFLAAPLRWENLPTDIQDLGNIDPSVLVPDLSSLNKDVILDLVKPAGIGAAVDLGMTYKPIKNLQITASVTDLGFIHWSRHARASVGFEGTFHGVEVSLEDAMSGSGNMLSGLTDSLSGMLGNVHISDIRTDSRSARAGMLTANLNVGIDANFWKNRIGIGVYSRTQFYNDRVAEELTFGAALRPANWFQLAATYSLFNGHASNIGAALSFAPYDGLMFTVATDYVPLTYAKLATSIAELPLPYKTPGFNCSFGIAIVAGTNSKKAPKTKEPVAPKIKKKDLDGDGVLNTMDLCPDTPLEVAVDENGCPLDTDADGAADYLDQCPDTPLEANGMVDSLGCLLDTDGDGVYDYQDLCPDTPAEAANAVDDNGCPMDTDDDGVYDYQDLCPDTPDEARNTVDENGCPMDTDGDGIADYLDQCPDTPLEAAGYIDAVGCPLDTDGDGVYDYLDQCPNTPAEATNFVDTNGCVKDTDGDGIYDYEDICPTIPGVKANRGCPEVDHEVQSVVNRAMAGIQFENGKAVLKSSSYEVLDYLADLFIENPEYKIEVQGHTDDLGQYDFNLDLSNRRAHAVRSYLVNQGVPASQLTARGYGSNMPIADNSTKEGRSLNTRVAFDLSFDPMLNDTIDFE